MRSGDTHPEPFVMRGFVFQSRPLFRAHIGWANQLLCRLLSWASPYRVDSHSHRLRKVTIGSCRRRNRHCVTRSSTTGEWLCYESEACAAMFDQTQPINDLRRLVFRASLNVHGGLRWAVGGNRLLTRSF